MWFSIAPHQPERVRQYCTLCREPWHRQKRLQTSRLQIPSVHQLRIRILSIRMYSMQRMRRHDPQKRFERRVSEQVHRLPRHARAEGHNRNDCPRVQRCSDCNSTTHKSALSFACPEHKCTKCQGARAARPQPKRLLVHVDRDIGRSRLLSTD